MAILGMVAIFSTIIDFQIFTTDTFQTEKLKIISLLTKTRSRAMANLFSTPHGVCYIEPNYIIFQNTCDPENSSSELIPAHTPITSNANTLFPTVTFERLTGNSSEETIYITDGIKSAEIKINNAGTINW